MEIKTPKIVTFTGDEIRTILAQKAARKIGITEKFDVKIKFDHRQYNRSGNGKAAQITLIESK